MNWTLAARSSRMNFSAIRETLELTEREGVLSLAGGLPSAEGFPVEALREATAKVLRDTPPEALQYAASEGHGPLRDVGAADPRTLRLSFLTLTPALIERAVAALGKLLYEASARGSRQDVQWPASDAWIGGDAVTCSARRLSL